MLNKLFLFLITIFASVFLVSNLEALAANDCSPEDAPHTCWNFDAGYTITVDLDSSDVIEGDLEKWVYTVEKKKNASTNNIIIGIEKDLKVDLAKSNETEINAPCAGDTTDNVGVGDCLRQYGVWTPNFNTGLAQLILYVKAVDNVNTMPLFVKNSNDTESGTILGPATDHGQIVENTFFINNTKDGRAIAVQSDMEGEVLAAWTCRPDPSQNIQCDSFPINFEQVGQEDIGDMEDTYLCIPASDEHPANTTLAIAPDVDFHCGYVEFVGGENTTIQLHGTATPYYYFSGGQWHVIYL